MTLRSLLALSALALLLSACFEATSVGSGPDTPDASDTPPACAVPCGTACCTDGQICNAASGACETPASCTPKCSGRECGADGCGGTCGTCPDGKTCDAKSGTCFIAPPMPDAGTPADAGMTGVKCAAPTALNFMPDDAFVISDTSAQTDEFAGSCGSNGPEDVYLLTLPATRDVTISASSRTAGYQPAIFVKKTCAGTGSGEELACSKTVATGVNTLVISSLPAGTYALFVEAASGTVGQAEIRVHLSNPTQGDGCADATPLVFTNGKATATGDTTAALDDGAGTCLGSVKGPDVVYALTLAAPQNVIVKVTPDAATPNFAPAVYLRAPCSSTATSAEKVCATGQAGRPLNTTAFAVPAGTWYLWVDGAFDNGTGAGSKGRFTLDVTLAPPAVPPTNEACGMEQALTFTNGVATASNDTTLAKNDSTGSCGGTGGDVVYSFTTTAVQNLSFVVASKAGSQLDPVLYVRKASCASTQGPDQLACLRAFSAGGSAAFLLNKLPAGTYWVFVDSGFSPGAFDLTITATTPTTPPANDACGGAAQLTFTNGRATVTGDLSSATDDTNTCGRNTTAADVVYSFTLAQAATVTARTVAENAAFNPTVEIRSVCASTSGGDSKACPTVTPAPGSGVSQATAKNLPAGTYFVWVDSPSGGGGRFTLDVLSSTAPANDGCSGAQTLALVNGSATVSGDTLGAASDASGSCAFTSTSPDAVYSFTLTDTSQVTATVTADAATPFSPVLYIRTLCSSTLAADEKACGRGTFNGTTATVSAKSLPAGTYYLWVDSSSADGGRFTLKLDAAAIQVPKNDACAGAQALTFTNNVATATGETTFANNDASASCTFGATGPDTVYSFTLAQAQQVAVKVTPDAATPFTPAVYLRKVCSSTLAQDELGCSTRPGTGGAVTVTNTNLPAGTYYAWVDGTGTTSSGRYTLEVGLTAPIVIPANDTCSAPEALTFTNDVASVSSDTSLAANDSSSQACGGQGGDVVYSFTLATAYDVDVEMTAKTGGLDPVVYVRKNGCASTARNDELGCAMPAGTATNAKLTLPRLAAGTYWVFADGFNGTKGTFDLKVTRRVPPPPPANDACAGATALTFTNNAVSVKGTTVNAANDTLESCGGTTGTDVVYAFTLTTTQRVTATVTRDAASTNYQPVVSIRGACATASDERACAVAGFQNPAVTAAADNLGPGTYYVWVDGGGTTAGAFTLDLALSAPVPPASTENCDSPGTLTFTNGVATASGNLRTFKNDATSSCGFSTGPDVVYQFTTTAAQQITVSSSSTSGFAPTVTLRDACRSILASDELGCAADRGGTGGKDSFVLPNVPAGTYFLWVDGNADFSLKVELAAPVPPPSNDTCASPTVLTIGNADTSSTFAAKNDYGAIPMSQACSAVGAASMDAPDVVYSFTPTQTGPVTITVAPSTTTFNPVIWVTTGTCGGSSACVAATDAQPAGRAENLTLNAVANTTYFIVVDSYRKDTGDFFINVH